MPRIVIVGAGPAAIQLVTTLALKLTSTDHTEVVFLEENAPTYPSSDFVIPESTGSTFVKIVRVDVTRISADGEVAYRAIEAIQQEVTEFDYLVVASGSTHSTSIKPAVGSFSRIMIELQMKEVREQIELAQKILIVDGGGAIGCEVAGNIATKFPNKTVTLLDAAPTLFAKDEVSSEFRDCIHDALVNKVNVKLILDEHLVSERLTTHRFVNQTCMTDRGTLIESDVQLFCGDFHPVAATLVEGMGASLVDDRGAIKVNPQLQLLGGDRCYSNIFVLGDASDISSPTQDSVAVEQARFLATELVGVIREKQPGVYNAVPEYEDCF